MSMARKLPAGRMPERRRVAGRRPPHRRHHLPPYGHLPHVADQRSDGSGGRQLRVHGMQKPAGGGCERDAADDVRQPRRRDDDDCGEGLRHDPRQAAPAGGGCLGGGHCFNRFARYRDPQQLALMREIIGDRVVQAMGILPHHQRAGPPDQAETVFRPLDVTIKRIQQRFAFPPHPFRQHNAGRRGY